MHLATAGPHPFSRIVGSPPSCRDGPAGRLYKSARLREIPILVAARPLRITNPKILALLERILLGEIPGALCAFALNGLTHFHREGSKDAKKTPRRFGCG